MRKKFVFALQPVLDQRQRIEDEKKQTVALRQRAWDEARRELDRLNEEFRSHATLLRTKHRELDAERLRLNYAHLQFLDRVINAQIRVVAERQAALDRARADLVEARKERKVVEKLRERRKNAYLAEEMRIEQGELDDGNARAHARAHAPDPIARGTR
ncbi:MAG TPA: flagellar export protein FliJ [Verrucomicrobiae bacterium]|nr:flagellar export protein FliJ [Verrucomicrobiae bacterium]